MHHSSRRAHSSSSIRALTLRIPLTPVTLLFSCPSYAAPGRHSYRPSPCRVLCFYRALRLMLLRLPPLIYQSLSFTPAAERPAAASLTLGFLRARFTLFRAVLTAAGLSSPPLCSSFSTEPTSTSYCIAVLSHVPRPAGAACPPTICPLCSLPNDGAFHFSQLPLLTSEFCAIFSCPLLHPSCCSSCSCEFFGTPSV